MQNAVNYLLSLGMAMGTKEGQVKAGVNELDNPA